MSEGRVYLRPITAADTAQIVAWRNRDFVRKNFIYLYEEGTYGMAAGAGGTGACGAVYHMRDGWD